MVDHKNAKLAMNAKNKKICTDGYEIIRQYDNYSQYISHQSEKLSLRKDVIAKHDAEHEQIIKKRYANIFESGSKILCLAARLGGEVRAFRSIGMDAIGIDINPGDTNSDVIYGDIHDVPFDDKSFDIVYCNSIDHVLYINKMNSECHRVLKNHGTLVLEITSENPSKYEVSVIKDYFSVIKMFDLFFLVSSSEIINKTSFVNWKGYLTILQKIRSKE